MNHDIFLPFDRILYRSLDDLAVARRQWGLRDHYWKRYALSGRKSIRSRVYGRIPAARPVVRGIVVGIMVALPGRKHHDYPTRTHAVTPADHSYTRASAWTTPESASYRYCYCYCYGFCCRRWNRPPYYWSLLLPFRVPFRTSGIRRIEKCSVSSFVIAFLQIVYIPRLFPYIWECSIA